MNSEPFNLSRRKGCLLLACYGCLLIVFVIPAFRIRSQTWISAAAEVESSRIQGTRPGTLAWSIMVDFVYQFGNQTYRKANVDVFHDTDLSVAEAELSKWPVGKNFTIYHSKQNPRRFSLTPDGNFEVSVVIAVLLSVATFLVLLPFFIAVNRGGNTNPKSE